MKMKTKNLIPNQSVSKFLKQNNKQNDEQHQFNDKKNVEIIADNLILSAAQSLKSNNTQNQNSNKKNVNIDANSLI